MTTRRLTVGQALVEFLAHQYTVDGDVRERTIPGILGIFGHGNVAGLGQALKQYNVSDPTLLPYHQARNEQAMVHQAVGFARMHRRRATLAATASVGPGAANMLTGAALATANRMPALLLPSDTFATRVADPVLQQIELPHDLGIQVTDAFRPLSRFFDRVQRPEQLYSIALGALRVLTDPAETGAVTIALPEDVQAEAIDVPVEFLQDREWHLRRPVPEKWALRAAVAAIQGAKKPFVVVGGGVIYSGAEQALRELVELTGIPVGTSQAGGGALNWDHPQYLGGVGATGTTAANRLAAEADVVIGIGTRYSDFTTASRTAFQNPDVTFVNINIASFDAYKHGSQIPVIADARETLEALRTALAGFRVEPVYAARIAAEKRAWDGVVDEALIATGAELPGQAEIVGAVQAASDPKDVVVQAAGSLPGDLHKLWRVRDPLGYHVEYAFSCMGYEIAGGLGAKRGLEALGDDRDVIVMVGDGSYLMHNSDIYSSVLTGHKLIVVLCDNGGFAVINRLQNFKGSKSFNNLIADCRIERLVEVDFAKHAEAMGALTETVHSIGELEQAFARAKKADRTSVIVIKVHSHQWTPGDAWWDVGVPEVSERKEVRAARADHEAARSKQRVGV